MTQGGYRGNGSEASKAHNSLSPPHIQTPPLKCLGERLRTATGAWADPHHAPVLFLGSIETPFNGVLFGDPKAFWPLLFSGIGYRRWIGPTAKIGYSPWALGSDDQAYGYPELRISVRLIVGPRVPPPEVSRRLRQGDDNSEGGSLRKRQHHIAVLSTRLHVVVGFDDLLERIRTIDNRAEGAGFDQLS